MELDADLNAVSSAVLRHVQRFGRRGLVLAVVVATLAIVLAGTVWGMWLAGTPHEQWPAAILTAMIIAFVCSLMVSTPIVDISTALATALDEMGRQARTDALTGVYARQAFLDAAADLDCARRVTVAMIDVDRFKLVNDRYGHAAGDTTLVNVADRLRSVLPTSVVGRLGGDEFAIAAIDEDTSVADTLRTALARIPVNDDADVSCSFGTACWRASEPLDEALQRADLELLEHKRALHRRDASADWRIG